MCRLSETWEKLAGNLVVSVDKLSSIGYSPVVATSQGLATMTSHAIALAVPRLPTAVLSTGLMVLAFLSVAVGLILDTVTRGRREMKLLAYLSHRRLGE